MADPKDHATELYESWLEWRRDRWIENLREISQIPEAAGEAFPPRNFPYLPIDGSGEDEVSKSLRTSALEMSCEAVETFVFGSFQSCILATGATLERVLKLEYRLAKGNLPRKGQWTLGGCVNGLSWEGTRVDEHVLQPIRELLSPRNSRAHALLEHSDPKLAGRGGPRRGVRTLSSNHYVTEPYRGEAKNALLTLYSILSTLYGPEPRETGT